MQRQVLTFGGRGGSAFELRDPRSVGFQSGGVVDAIILNGDRFGGGGGPNATAVEVLDADDYWSELYVRSGNLVDYVSLKSAKGHQVAAGGPGGTANSYTGIRIVGIGGHAYEFVDSLTVDMIVGYKKSTVVEEGVRIVLDMATGGQVFRTFTNQTTTTLNSYRLVSERSITQNINVSAGFDFFAKMQTQAGITIKDSRTETIATDITKMIATGDSSETTVPDDHASFLIAKADIMADSDGNKWIAPTRGADWVTYSETQYHKLIGMYDITSGTEPQTGLTSKIVNGLSRLKAAA